MLITIQQKLDIELSPCCAAIIDPERIDDRIPMQVDKKAETFINTPGYAHLSVPPP